MVVPTLQLDILASAVMKMKKVCNSCFGKEPSVNYIEIFNEIEKVIIRHTKKKTRQIWDYVFF